MRRLSNLIALRAWALVVVALWLNACGAVSGGSRAEHLAEAGREAVATLAGVDHSGRGSWRACDAARDRATGDSDWGADSLTYALALQASLRNDRRLLPMLRALARNAPAYAVPCGPASGCGWSDVAEWDSIAAQR